MFYHLKELLQAQSIGITAKTTKAVVTSAIPVVGKLLGETVDAVLGSANILKNAVGFVRSYCCGFYMYFANNKACNNVNRI